MSSWSLVSGITSTTTEDSGVATCTTTVHARWRLTSGITIEEHHMAQMKKEVDHMAHMQELQGNLERTKAAKRSLEQCSDRQVEDIESERKRLKDNIYRLWQNHSSIHLQTKKMMKVQRRFQCLQAYAVSLLKPKYLQLAVPSNGATMLEKLAKACEKVMSSRVHKFVATPRVIVLADATRCT